MSTPILLSVTDFCEKHKSFKPGGLKRQIFDEKINGLDDFDVVVRLGRKVLLDEEKYFKWLEFQSKKSKVEKLISQPTEILKHALKAQMGMVSILVNELESRNIPDIEYHQLLNINSKI